MPDWSYRTLLRPPLFLLPPEQARDLTLRATGTLAALPLGPQLIETVGDMRPAPALRRSLWGLDFPGPVGLGAGSDRYAGALTALARFGFGFIEVGPVTAEPIRAPAPLRRMREGGALWHPACPANQGVDAMARRLARARPLPVPIGVRLAHAPGADASAAARERAHLIERLAPYASFFTLDTTEGLDIWAPDDWVSHLSALRAALGAARGERPLLVCVAPDTPEGTVDTLLGAMVARGLVDGVVVTGGIFAAMESVVGPAPGPGRLTGLPTRARSLDTVRRIHGRWGDTLPIVGSGGVHEPLDALRLLDAGASLVQIHSGLVYSGPGLPKRINDTVEYAASRRADARSEGPQASLPAVGARSPSPLPPSPPWPLRLPPWTWGMLLGVGLIVGGILAWLVAATCVVLPYDEAFVGLTRAQLAALNPRLLPFMAHDRVTVAGAMLSTGVLYVALARYGLRDGARWARRTFLVSGAPGFVSFLLFLGYRYFDPLHALVTALLLPFFLLGLSRRPSPGSPPHLPAPNLRNSRRWLCGVWGQFLFVAIGGGLALAGLAIAAIGATTVFVPTDLMFLRTSAAALSAANPHLLSLVAHDRAGFGGDLVSVGLAVLCIALWGFREGARWVWWTLLCAGAPGFVAALGVHVAVGYMEISHLAPALIGLALYVAGLVLAYPYLCAPAPRTNSSAHRSDYDA